MRHYAGEQSGWKAAMKNCNTMQGPIEHVPKKICEDNEINQ